MSGYVRKMTLAGGKIRFYPCMKIDGKEHSFGGYKKRRDAEARLRVIEGQVAAGTYGREDMTLAAFYERWIASKSNLKPSTRVSYEHTFRLHVLPAFKRKHVLALKPMDIQSWVNDLSEKGLAPASVARCFRYLRACLKSAEAWGLLDKSPCQKINLPRSNHAELSFLEPEDIAALLAAARDPESVLFATLALSGLRLGEGLALAWRHVDFEHNALTVERSWSFHGGFMEPKTASSRRAVPMMPALAATLADFYRAQGEPEPDALLFSFDGSKPLDPANVRKRFLEALEAAGLKRVTLHSLRHSYASLMLACGASIKALQRSLGHASAAMTLNTYAHLIQEDLGGSLARASEVVTGAEGKLASIKKRRKG